MRVQDLGERDGAVLLFGGPYSNLAAMRALSGEARRQGVPADHMICTGDVVAYCADPAETVAEIRSLGCPVVAGNCERQLAENALDCGCGFEEGSTCDLLSAGWYAHADAAIGAPDRDWMGQLPDIVTFTHRGQKCAVIHGGATDISRFIWPNSPDAVLAEEVAHIEAVTGPVDRVIAGHSGLAFERRVGTVEWLNAGVIGMPPNDGAPGTRYALLQDGRVEIRVLSYDHYTAAESMRRCGLTQGYDAALSSGFWPSEEVLPSELRRSACASG